MIGFTVEHLREDCQNSILRVQKFLWRNLISGIIINFSFRGLWANTFRTFSENFLAEMHYCLLRVKEEIFERTRFSSNEEYFLHQFLTFSWWFSGFYQNKNRKGHQNCIPPIQRNILAKNCIKNSTLSVFQQKNLELLAFGGIFYHGCQNFLLRLRKKNFLREQNFEKKDYSFPFWERSWERMFQTFARKLRAEPSKLHFTCPVDQFEENAFLKSCVSSFLPDFVQRVSDFFVKSLSSRIVKQAFYVPKRIFL